MKLSLSPAAVAVPTAAMTNPADPRSAKLLELAELRNNWDGDAAQPPSAAAMARAREALRHCQSRSLMPRSVLPSAEGGVGLVWEENGRYADLEFLNSGEIGAVTDDRRGNVEAWALSTMADVPATVERIRSFLRG